MNLAKKEGIWQEKYVGCCTITPTNPTTNASFEKVMKIIEAFHLEELIEANFSTFVLPALKHP